MPLQPNSLTRWPHLPLLLLALLSLGSAILFWLLPPLPQDPAYHRFADTRRWIGIPNIGDVLSNALLLLAGIAGLATIVITGRAGGGAKRFRGGLDRGLYLLFFAAVCLTAAGSAYYHWSPDTPRLFWDRLPLSLLTMLLPAILIAERGTVTRLGLFALGLWLLSAPASVGYWIWSEGQGEGDLRWYWATQLVSILAAVGLLETLTPRLDHSRYYLYALIGYALARGFEALDRPIFALGSPGGFGGLVSGHSLKHLTAGLAVALLAHMIAHRKPLPLAPRENGSIPRS